MYSLSIPLKSLGKTLENAYLPFLVINLETGKKSILRLVLFEPGKEKPGSGFPKFSVRVDEIDWIKLIGNDKE